MSRKVDKYGKEYKEEKEEEAEEKYPPSQYSSEYAKEVSDYRQLRGFLEKVKQNYSMVVIKEALSELPGPASYNLDDINELLRIFQAQIDAFSAPLFYRVIEDLRLSAAEQLRTDEGISGAVIDPANLVCMRVSGPFYRVTRLLLEEKTKLGEEWRLTMKGPGKVEFTFLVPGTTMTANTLTFNLQEQDSIIKESARGPIDRGLIVVRSYLGGEFPSGMPRVTMKVPPAPMK
jgi:hypothetical protein